MREFDPTKVINGTWGTVWFNNAIMSECTAFQAKDEFDIQEVPMAGKMHKGHKITGVTSKGSMKLQHVDNTMVQAIGRQVRDGLTPTFTVMSKLADPSSYGCERMAFHDVVLENLTIADWEVGKLGEREVNFVYRDYTRMDVIE